MLLIQDSFFLDIDFIRWLFAFEHAYVITHLALQAYICHQPVAGFRVYAREVTRVWIAIGVTVLYINY